MPKERIFSEDELTKILARAEALQKLEEARDYHGLLESAREDISLESLDKGITSGIIYEVAHEIGILERYVERSLELQHIPYEKQLEDIRNHNSNPTPKLIREVYERELLRSLREFSPLEKFDTDYNTIDPKFVRIEERKRKRFFGIRKPKKIWTKHELARIYSELLSFNSRYLAEYTFTLKDPLFLRACGDTLNELKDKTFKGFVIHNIKHDYEV